MSFEKSCKFYQDSKCILSGGCCDLSCESTNFDRSDQFYDEIDPFTKWRIEKAQKEKNSESKLSRALITAHTLKPDSKIPPCD